MKQSQGTELNCNIKIPLQQEILERVGVKLSLAYDVITNDSWLLQVSPITSVHFNPAFILACTLNLRNVVTIIYPTCSQSRDEFIWIRLQYWTRTVRENKTLLVYDAASKQVRWLMYRIESKGTRNYAFMKGGAYAYFANLRKNFWFSGSWSK